MQLPARILTPLAQALQQPTRAGRFPQAEWRRVLSQGWAYLYEIHDMLIEFDRRLYDVDLRGLAECVNLPLRFVSTRPRFLTAESTATLAMAVNDVAALCIFLEQCGFLIDPAPMVADLYTSIKVLTTMTTAEVELYSFTKLRHRHQITLRSVEQSDLIREFRKWRSTQGYRFELWTRGDQVTMLKVRGAKWRERPRIDITCAVCDLTYTKGDPESALSHRQEHMLVTRLLSPTPNRKMRERLDQGPYGERVDANAPLWMHRQVFERARRFKRDFGYDKIQWPSVHKRANIDPTWVGYLFASPDGTIDGACAFKQDEGEWALGWVWIRPERRRSGLLAARWPAFIADHGDFWIERPLSVAMQAFIERYATDGQRRMIAESIRVDSQIAVETTR